MTRGLGGHSPSNIAHNLRGVDFPAQKQSLVEQAKQNGAEDKVLDVIGAMPDGEYQDMADVNVMKGVGEAEQGSRRTDH
jgi:hypothetical protein